MSKISSYGKIESLTFRNMDVFNDDIIIQEKVDGSQISFGIIDNELIVRSKGQLINKDKAGMFSKAINYLFSIRELLEKNIIYRGEYLQKEKHNVLAYDRIPNNNIMLFDIEDLKRNSLSKEEKLRLAKQANLEFVLTLFEGQINQDEIKNKISELFKIPSILGSRIEGIVIKNYNMMDKNGKYTCVKYVSDEFKEKHNRKKVKMNNKNDISGEIASSLKTEIRYLKAVIHLKEIDNLKFSNEDIGSLLKEIHKDIEDEEQDFIKDLLYEHYIKGIKKDVAAGFVNWYKQYLINFEE